MLQVGILERSPSLSAYLAACLPEPLLAQVDLRPAGDFPTPPDLLVVSPDLASEDRAPDMTCRALLVPGRLSPLAADLGAAWAVSYGLNQKDSLTLSTLGEAEMGLALQRELVTLTGACLDRQEFTLPTDHHAPLHVLACAGVQLLLGIPPEEVQVQGRPMSS